MVPEATVQLHRLGFETVGGVVIDNRYGFSFLTALPIEDVKNVYPVK